MPSRSENNGSPEKTGLGLRESSPWLVSPHFFQVMQLRYGC